MEINTLSQVSIDKDQKCILFAYSLYTNEQEYTYLQYTAACALVFYLSQKGFFNYNLNELLVYDYKEERRYIWESKKFMADINILRDNGLLLRARSRSKTSHDVNAHQCTILGHQYVKYLLNTSPEIKKTFDNIKRELSCNGGEIKKIKLLNDAPHLCCRYQSQPIKGFLKSFAQSPDNSSKIPPHNPFFI
ncbi:MAG: hypothetical protein Q8R90_11160 [Bacteroidales bacterium]|nr:hypothetical protein [Bacteroidales bacterium]